MHARQTAESRHRIAWRLDHADHHLAPCNILKNPTCTPYEIAKNVVESFGRAWPETLAEAPHFAQILRNTLVVPIACGLPLGVDSEIAIADVIAAHDPSTSSGQALDIEESSSPDAWLLTLGLQDGRPCIDEHRSIWLPDYDPDVATDLDAEPETLEGKIPGPDYYEETFGL